MSDTKVEVEAERGKGKNAVVLTLVSVPERRRLMRQYGTHNVYVNNLHRLGTFPPHLITEFYKGYPVRFKMNLRGYERLLEAPGVEALGETLDAATNKEGLTWEEWVQAAGYNPKKLSIEQLEIFTNSWRRGDDPSEYKGTSRKKKR